ncbi:hypothetical protein WG70_06555 [Burkholderia oklahomensis EO147]|nr:hypothetical protein WG70_06555 [Burkholderia oklahomensis EO147]AOI49001.1 hypothetical protein WI23_24680 [Burkholderia oklahomensis C6786]KUY47880.1 hypothetical protein WG70_22270 [Burkholderia oklahomensis EO147]KUY61095.1 hypothetical protein WI23_12680 [Burkholderia oklahomensis C6786]
MRSQAAASIVRTTSDLRSFVLFAKESACYQSRIRCESRAFRRALRGEYARYEKNGRIGSKTVSAHWRA